MAAREGKHFYFYRMALTAMLVMLLGWPIGTPALAADAAQQWQQLNAQATEAFQAGEYAKGMASAEQALQLARQAFGPRDPATLRSLNNLAVLYQGQGRYGEAEPLYREALQGRREVLGPRHPDTLGTQLNLVVVLVNQSRRQEGVVCGRGRNDTLRIGPAALHDLGCLSPSGFAWGYRGAGPGQLALALLADTLGDRFALAYWDRFRDELISCLGFLWPFTLTSDDIEAFRSGLPEAAALR
jgi:tetratricopeptide (TPR) repeat protein